MDPGAISPETPISDESQSQIHRHAAPPTAERFGSGRSTRSGIATIACFAGLVVLLAFAADHAISRGLRNLNTLHFGAIHKVMKGQVDAEIIINGSSRAMVHYDPRIVQDITGATAYNLGRNGSQTDMQLAILKTYLKRNPRPQIVVHNLDLFSFEMTKAGEVYEPGFYVPYLDEDEIYHALVNIDPETWKWKYIPLYGYTVADMGFTWVTGVRGFLGIHPREEFFLGYHWRDVSWTGDFERFKATHPSGIRREVEPAGIRALEELVALCQNRGIQPILVYSPEYLAMQELEVNRQEVFAHFREIARKHNVPLWDYSDSAISRNREFFYNSQHLSGKGAAAFSVELAKRLSREFLPSRRMTRSLDN